MADFKKFAENVNFIFTRMSAKELYVVDVADIYNSYLSAFPEGTNPIFIKRPEYDCNCCKNFITRLGILVTMDAEGNRETVWQNHAAYEYPFNVVAKALHDLVMQAPIRHIFRTKQLKYGDRHTWSENGVFDHFYGIVGTRHRCSEPGEAIGAWNNLISPLTFMATNYEVKFFDDVLALINSNNLYRGIEFKNRIIMVRDFVEKAKKASDLNAFVIANASRPIADFKNSAIGTLFNSLAAGKPMDVALSEYRNAVNPQNYRRSTVSVSGSMVESANAKIEELGLADSLFRRVAVLGDISINNVLWANRDAQNHMKKGIAAIIGGTKVKKAAFPKHTEEVSIQQFLDDVLPNASAVSLFVEKPHVANLFSLTTSDSPEKLFWWDNQFSWSYRGGYTDAVAERVKKAGGAVNVPFRVSLAWDNSDDLDLHCVDPKGHTIDYGNKRGILDVDANGGMVSNANDPVENMAWRKPENGVYKFYVHQFNSRGRNSNGFSVHIATETGETVLSFAGNLRDREKVCFNVEYKYGVATVIKQDSSLSTGTISSTVWGVKTEEEVPVSAVLLSPNYWDEQKAAGNLHYFFCLEGCSSPDPVRGIYNEFLRSDLMEHRKVFEILGSKTQAHPVDNGLSGVGFSSTIPVSIRFKVTDTEGNTRPYTVKI